MGLVVRTSFLNSLPIALNKKIRNEVQNYYSKARKLRPGYNKKIIQSNIGEMEIIDEMKM